MPDVTLRPELHAFDGALWQVRPAADGAPLLALEVRDEAAHSVQFYALQPGHAPLPLHPPAPDWWLSLVGAAHGCVLVQAYADPALPVARGLTALCATAGTPRWQHPHCQLVQVCPQGFVVTNAQGKPALVSPDGHIQPLLHTQGQPQPLVPQQQFPGLALHTDAAFAQLADRLQPHLPSQPVLQIEYLRIHDRECVVAHTRADTSADTLGDTLGDTTGTQPATELYDTHLMLLSPQGLLFHQQLATQTAKISLDSFFCWHSRIVYVLAGHTLGLLELG